MEKLQALFYDTLSQNPYFNAGAGLFGMGLGISILKKSAQIGNMIIRRNFTLTLEVASHDKAYPWVLSWITQKAISKNRNWLTRGAGQHLSVDTNVVRSESGRIFAEFQFIPSTGIHYLYHNNRIIKVERVRASQTLQGASTAPFESVTLTTIGRDRKLFSSLLEEARSTALSKEEGWTPVYKAVGHEWRPFGFPRRKRPLNSVVLARGVAEDLVGDLSDFLDNQEWYIKRGIPYRRGYLLYGPPGCGKSSFISAVAGHFDLSLCVLSLSEIGMSSDRLDHLLTHAPMQSIVVLEDIDVAVPGRDSLQMDSSIGSDNGKSDPLIYKFNSILNFDPFVSHVAATNPYAGMRNLTLSGLLNALDGVTSSEGRILFMTTNFIDRLDSALVRPGRVDRVVKVDLCDREQVARLFSRFYPHHSDMQEHPMAQTFASIIGDTTASAAQIQGYLLMHKERPDVALEDAEAFLTALRTHKVTR
ncbi:mitochondrial chaperone [Cichlidogyrus casuarinus]|uniref:Mitochondrial chaperone BCS1 n=1 Tax=Cichlidogyrus casuarinus TaxID=1844966 RepID=A0ABD2Q6C7_9PLAT